MSCSAIKLEDLSPKLMGLICMCSVKYLMGLEKEVGSTRETPVLKPEQYTQFVSGLSADEANLVGIRILIRLIRRFGRTRRRYVVNGEYQEWKNVWAKHSDRPVTHMGDEEIQDAEEADWA